MSNTWRFYYDRLGCWKWQKQTGDGGLLSSRTCFLDYDVCRTDAARHGFDHRSKYAIYPPDFELLQPATAMR